MLLVIASVFATILQPAATDSCVECLTTCTEYALGGPSFPEGYCQDNCNSPSTCPNLVQMDLCTKAEDGVCQAGQRKGCGTYTDCTDCKTCPEATSTVPTTVTTTTTTDCKKPRRDPRVWSITPALVVVHGPGCTKHGDDCVSSRNYPAAYATTTRDYCTIKVPAGSTLSVEEFNTEPHYWNPVGVVDDALPSVQHEPNSYYRGDYLVVNGKKVSGHARCELDGMVHERETPILWKSDGLLWNNRNWNQLTLDHTDTSVKNYTGWKICFAKIAPKVNTPAELVQHHLTTHEPVHCSRKLARQNACEPNPDPACKAISDRPLSERNQLCFHANDAPSLTRRQLRDRQKCKFECGLCNGFYKTTRPAVDFGAIEGAKPCKNDNDCVSNVCVKTVLNFGTCKEAATKGSNNETEAAPNSITITSPAAAATKLLDCPILAGDVECASNAPGLVLSPKITQCKNGGRRAKKVGEWHCRDDSRCINWGWRCNGVAYCADESDESWGCPGDVNGDTGMAKVKFSEGGFNDIEDFNSEGNSSAALLEYHGFEFTDASFAFFTAATGGAKVGCRANSFPGFKNVTEAVVVDKQTLRMEALDFQQKLSSDCADPRSASYGAGGHINFGNQRACNAVVGPLTFLLRSTESYVSGTKAVWGLPGYGAEYPEGDAYSNDVRPAVTDNIVLVCSGEGSLFVGHPTRTGYDPSDSDAAAKEPAIVSWMDSTESCNFVASLLNLAVGKTPMELNIHEKSTFEAKKALYDNATDGVHPNLADSLKNSWTMGSSRAGELNDDVAGRDDDFWEEKQQESYEPDGDFRVHLWKGRTVGDWPDRFIFDFFSGGYAPTSIWGASIKGTYRYDNITKSVLAQGWVSPAKNLTSLTTLEKLELRMRWEIVSFLTEEDVGRDAFGKDKAGQPSGLRHYAKQTFMNLINGFTVAGVRSNSSSITFGVPESGVHPVTAAITTARAGMISKIRGGGDDELTFESFSAVELMAWGDPTGPSGSGTNNELRAELGPFNEIRILDLDARLSTNVNGLDARLFVVEGKVEQKDDNTEAVHALRATESKHNAEIKTLSEENSVLKEEVSKLKSQMITVMNELADRRARADPSGGDDDDGRNGLPIAAIVVVAVVASVLLIAAAAYKVKTSRPRTGDLAGRTPIHNRGSISSLSGPMQFGTEDSITQATFGTVMPGLQRLVGSDGSGMLDREVFSTKYVADRSTDISGSSIFSSSGSMDSVVVGGTDDLGGILPERSTDLLPFGLTDMSEGVGGRSRFASFDDSFLASSSSSMSSGGESRGRFVSMPLTPARIFGLVDQSQPQTLPQSRSSVSVFNSSEMAEDPDATIVRRRTTSGPIPLRMTSNMSSTNPRLSPAFEEAEESGEQREENRRETADDSNVTNV